MQPARAARPVLFLAALIVLIAWPGRAAVDGAATSTATRTVRLLAIGNSFSGNALRFLTPLCATGGVRLVVGHASIGGGSFKNHWDKHLLHLKDPADPKGLYGAQGLQEMLTRERWDYITIQQYSLISHDRASHAPWAGNLVGLCRKLAPQARILVHQTWAYRADDPRFTGRPDGKSPRTREAMYQGLTAAYDALAREFGLGTIPVGDAFDLADSDPTWGFRPDRAFDPKSAQPPALPDQAHSLHGGFGWRKEKDGASKLQYDGHHANLNGQYLAACVWFEALSGKPVVGNGFVPKDMPADYAAFLQRTAHEAVARRAAAGTHDTDMPE